MAPPTHAKDTAVALKALVHQTPEAVPADKNTKRCIEMASAVRGVELLLALPPPRTRDRAFLKRRGHTAV